MEALKKFERKELWWRGGGSALIGLTFALMMIDDKYTILSLIVVFIWIVRVVFANVSFLEHYLSREEVQEIKNQKNATVRLSIVWSVLLVISLIIIGILSYKLKLFFNPAIWGLCMGIVSFCGLSSVYKWLIYTDIYLLRIDCLTENKEENNE